MKPRSTPSADGNRLALVILTCFFLSGTTALIYEIIWMRMIARVIGGAPFAVSTILVVFMGGMGLGGYLAGRKADEMAARRLVRTYGLLELTIGIYALFVPVVLMLFRWVYGFLYNALFAHTLAYHLFIFAGAVLVLVPPAVCMGATLPLLCRFYVNRLSQVGSHAGRLYGLNTIGAAAGSLACGFWLINALGVWGTMLAAVGVNGAIGVTCLHIAGRPEHDAADKQRSRPAPPTPAFPAASGPPGLARGALAIFMVSGFCAMAYEVLWTKLLGLLVGPTTYSFTIVLVTFIVGLALGNLAFGRWADRTRDPMILLIATQVAAALAALLISQLLGDSQLFFAKLIDAFSDHFGGLSLVKALALFAFMLVPTFLLGATFPLTARMVTRSEAEVGRRIGVAYAFNTAGAVLGSFCAGFVLIPLLGKENGLRLVIGLQIATALIVAALAYRRRKAPVIRWTALSAASAAAILLCLQYPAWNRHLLATGKYHRFDETVDGHEMLRATGWIEALFEGPEILAAVERGELVYYGEGIGGFTTVLKYPGPFGQAEFSMANSGKMDASSRGDMKTQTLLAHFPMLFADGPEKVMVLGMASGVTAGEVLNYPIERLDVVDINGRVFEAARFFRPWNNHVLDHPRTRPIVQDGMAHLRLTRTRYDVIISEPSNPWMAGMAGLFTREFFASAGRRLTDTGIYVQWFHCYQMDWETFALIGRTFAEVFPDSLLVSCEPGGLSRDFLFVGFRNAGGLNWDAARRNIEYARRSNNIDLAYPELLVPMIVSEDLRRTFGPGPLNTEDRPLLEYAAPKLMHRGRAGQRDLMRQLAARMFLSPETRRTARRIRQSVPAQIDFAAYALSVHSPFMGMVDLSAADAAQKKSYTALLAGYCAEHPFDLSLAGDSGLEKHLRDVQIAALKKRLPAMPANAATHLYLARLFSGKGLPDEAIDQYRAAVRLDPDDASARNNLGFMLFDRGDTEAAVEHYRHAVRLRPGMVTAWGNLGFTYLHLNRLDDALFCFEKVLRIRPDIAETHYHIGRIHFEKRQWTRAARRLRQALRLAPDMADALNMLARVLCKAGDKRLGSPDDAVRLAQKACTLTDERNPDVLATLAAAYAAAGRTEASSRTAGKALKLARETNGRDVSRLIEGRLAPLIREE